VTVPDPPLPAELATALKEWAVVVDAMERGEQTLLLRKGGVADREGAFEAAHPAFLFYPTTEHQRPEAVKEPYRDRIGGAPPEPHEVGEPLRFTSAALVTDACAVPDRAALDALIAEHVLSTEQVDQRWRYKPERPLTVLVLRVYRLNEPRSLPFVRRYAGCRSWVPLAEPITLPPCTPALLDEDFERRRQRILAVLSRR
jgi:hypothetical protein